MEPDELNTQNAGDRRQQILEMARSAIESDRRQVREWVEAALTPGSEIREVAYRILNFDLDADVRDCMPAFRPGTGYHQRLSSRALRKLWRRLLGLYAFQAAREAARELARQPEEGLWWRLWIWKDCVMPRLVVAVLIGYLVVAGNSGLLQILWKAQSHDGWVAGICGFSVFCAYSLALAEVQRRVGRHVRLLLKGSAIMTLHSLFWAGVGGIAQYFGARALHAPVPGRFVLVCAASALAIAFLAQLFWQDRSIAEPL